MSNFKHKLLMAHKKLRLENSKVIHDFQIYSFIDFADYYIKVTAA